MKKLTKIMAFVLCAVMVFALCGCGISDDEKFIGTWEAEIDMTKQISDSLEAELGDAMSYFSFENITATMTFVFKEDGTYTTTVRLTEEGLAAYNEQFKAGMESAMWESIKAEAESYEMSMEEYEAEYLAQYGTTVEEDLAVYIESTIAEMDIQEGMKEGDTEGKWKAIAGTLLMTDSVDEEFADGDYDTYEDLTENSFKLTGGFSDGEADEAGLYPMLFNKVA